MQGVLQKFCITQPFFACGNTMAPKLSAHVTEGILSANAKFCSNQFKMLAAILTSVLKDKQGSVIWFLTLENVLGSKIHMRMCMKYARRMLSKNQPLTNGYKDSRLDERVRVTNLEEVTIKKKGPVWYATDINEVTD